MKKIMFMAVLVITGVTAFAQTKIRLNLYSAYVFDDSFDEFYDANTYFSGKIKGGYQWGGGFEFLPHPYTSVELMYLHKSSDGPISYRGGATQPKHDVTLDIKHDYILLAGNGIKPMEGKKVEPYGGLMAGIVITNVDNKETGASDSNTIFA